MTATVILQSITGVDVELRIAGPGSRSYAFVIDWHIRVLLVAAWYLVAFISLGGAALLVGNARWTVGLYFAFVLAPLAIYFLYHPVLEIAMHGRTPGKRIAGVRVVSRTGDIPGAGALLVRNVFRLIDSAPALYLLGLGFVVFTAQHVRIGDMAAGTLLVIDNTESDKSFGGLSAAAHSSGLSPEAADLVQELLDRWNSLDEGTRAGLARALLARVDPSTSAAQLVGETPWQLYSRLRAVLTRGKSA